MVTCMEEARYLIRDAQADRDAAALARIFSECFGPTTERQVRRWLQRATKESAGKFKSLVAELHGEVVGSVSVELKKLHLGEGVHVESGGIAGVCTCSDFRGKGIATNLLQRCLEYVEDLGLSNSSLYTGEMLPAHRIYRREGFNDEARFEAHIKFLDFDYRFRSWLRSLNRHLKVSRLARATLRGWERSVILELDGDKSRCFRYRQGGFQRLRQPLKSADIVVATTVETLTRVMWGETRMENAVKAGKIHVKRGTSADLRILAKILTGVWDE